MSDTKNEKQAVINHEERIVERKKVLEASFISKMKERKYSKTAVNQMIGGMSHSIANAKERLFKAKILTDNMLTQLEMDYSDDGDKEILRPQNEREYWLFTETHQMIKNFQKEINDLI